MNYNINFLKNIFHQNLVFNGCFIYLYLLKNFFYYQKLFVSNTDIDTISFFLFICILHQIITDLSLSENNDKSKDILKIHIKNYSKKYFVIFLKSKKFNKKFLNLNGKWENNLYNKKKKGWLFPKSKYNDVLSIINNTA